MTLGVLLLIAAFIVLLLALLLVQYGSRTRARFEQYAVKADAEITNLDTGRIRGVILNSTSYNVGYTYFTGSPGQEPVRHAGNYRINSYYFDKLKVGDNLPIVYLPDMPDISKPAPEYRDDGAERSSAWSPMYFASGIVIFLLVSAGMSQARDAQSATAAQQVNMQKQAAVLAIRDVLDSRIAEWRTSATFEPARLSGTSAGFGPATDFREVYYGNCKVQSEKRFYLLVFNYIYTGKATDQTWLARGYSYTPGTARVKDCVPEGWTVSSDAVVDGDWHEVFVIYPAQVPFYKLTATAQAAPTR